MDPVEGVAQELDAKLASFVKEGRLAGAAAGVVHKDDLAWFGSAGFADVERRRSPLQTTGYRVASITKTFTGTAVMQLRDAGRLHLDDPAVAHLPELASMSPRNGPVEAVTIRRMLSHESGLSGDPPGTDWTSQLYEGAAAVNLARAAELVTAVPPNTQRKYSNMAYQLLGEIVARVSGTPYPEYLSKSVLDPLGMPLSSFGRETSGDPSDLAVGYRARSYSDELERSPEVLPLVAEGGLWSCVEDLGRWLSLQLRAHCDRDADSPVISAATLREMHKPRYLGEDEDWSEAWGISWYAVRRDGVTWVQHSGSLPGFTSNVCFEPKAGVGAIVLVNGTSGTGDLSMALGAIARRAVQAVPEELTPPAPTPAEYRPLIGLYADPQDGFLLRVEWRDGKLTCVAPDDPTWRPTLEPTGDPNVFVVEPGVRESGESVVFRRLSDGRVASVLLASAGFARLAEVEGQE